MNTVLIIFIAFWPVACICAVIYGIVDGRRWDKVIRRLGELTEEEL